ncbi:MAG: P-loop NTPase [Myxococcota bacterium]|jgi:flagellar biosynthesis protein FlhG|nr:P-loop NTPase [Myxococcota bacterium]
MMTRATHDRPIELPRVHRGDGMHIVSVTGGKGGVGKSCISVNLALAVAKLGGRVLLLDGDLGLANADQLLGVHATSTLWDVLQGRVTLEGAVNATPYGVDLLPAASGRQEMAELSADSRADLLAGVRELGKAYDFIIIDTAAGIGDTPIELATAGDLVLAVVTPDPTSVRDAFSVMKILSKDKGKRRIDLVVNMVATHDDGLSLFRQISSVTAKFLPLSLGLAAAIPRDPNLGRSILERRPLVSAYPQSPASKQIGKLAAYVVAAAKEHSPARSEGGVP